MFLVPSLTECVLSPSWPGQVGPEHDCAFLFQVVQCVCFQESNSGPCVAGVRFHVEALVSRAAASTGSRAESCLFCAAVLEVSEAGGDLGELGPQARSHVAALSHVFTLCGVVRCEAPSASSRAALGSQLSRWWEGVAWLRFTSPNVAFSCPCPARVASLEKLCASLTCHFLGLPSLTFWTALLGVARSRAGRGC